MDTTYHLKKTEGNKNQLFLMPYLNFSFHRTHLNSSAQRTESWILKLSTVLLMMPNSLCTLLSWTTCPLSLIPMLNGECPGPGPAGYHNASTVCWQKQTHRRLVTAVHQFLGAQFCSYWNQWESCHWLKWEQNWDLRGHFQFWVLSFGSVCWRRSEIV